MGGLGREFRGNVTFPLIGQAYEYLGGSKGEFCRIRTQMSAVPVIIYWQHENVDWNVNITHIHLTLCNNREIEICASSRAWSRRTRKGPGLKVTLTMLQFSWPLLKTWELVAAAMFTYDASFFRNIQSMIFLDMLSKNWLLLLIENVKTI